MIKEIIKFSASWCGPCKAFHPTFEAVSKMDEFKDINFKELDIEDEDDSVMEMVENFKIQSVPTTVLVDENGEVLKKVIGNLPQSDFVSIIKSEVK